MDYTFLLALVILADWERRRAALDAHLDDFDGGQVADDCGQADVVDVGLGDDDCEWLVVDLPRWKSKNDWYLKLNCSSLI